MPWVHVLVPAETARSETTPSADALARSIALAGAQATGLSVDDFLVLVTEAAGSQGRGALVSVVGRGRPTDLESELRAGIVSTISDHIDVADTAVAYLRTVTA